jgi:DNA topoisomerase-1
MPVLASSSGLRHVEPGTTPGWARQKRGTGFVYLDERGRRITRENALSRVRKLAIPPAWTDVWICPDPSGHIQATGRDARGRLQYRYHARWVEQRSLDKYKKLTRFFRALPRLHRSVARDLKCDCVCRERVIATAVALMERGHMRVGSEEYTRQNGSHGVTTLERRHVTLNGRRIELRYRGKSGVMRHITIEDARLARALRACLALPGRRVFEYKDEVGKVRRITAADVNEYIRAQGGEPITAKFFRTWAASLRCLTALAALETPRTKSEAKRVVNACIKDVAQHLGHTPSVCRASYVHPRVIENFVEGKLTAVGGTRAAERALLKLVSAC